MSLKALPIMFVNLSGEMMYILDQRLKAQNISREKSVKVIHDIVSTMFNEQFVEELFKPQEIYSKQALRSVFEKLVHSSIMRLNSTSMDKLYDLMTMVFKYQIYLCSHPEDILFVTLNHLDAIRLYSTSSASVLKLVDNVYSLLLRNYEHMTSGDFQLLRYTLLAFFQDLHIRVSVFLKEGCQHPNGRFVLNKGGPVPNTFRVPGTIREFDNGGHVIQNVKFSTEDEYCPALPRGSLEPNALRATTLGKNVYSNSQSSGLTEDTASIAKPLLSEEINQAIETAQDPCVWEELTLLARLIGRNDLKKQSPEFTLGFFDEDTDVFLPVQGGVGAEGHTIVKIDAAKPTQRMQLNKVLAELTVEDKEKDTCDILELLDVASM